MRKNKIVSENRKQNYTLSSDVQKFHFTKCNFQTFVVPVADEARKGQLGVKKTKDVVIVEVSLTFESL